MGAAGRALIAGENVPLTFRLASPLQHEFGGKGDTFSRFAIRIPRGWSGRLISVVMEARVRLRSGRHE